MTAAARRRRRIRGPVAGGAAERSSSLFELQMANAQQKYRVHTKLVNTARLIMYQH